MRKSKQKGAVKIYKSIFNVFRPRLLQSRHSVGSESEKEQEARASTRDR
jgi:hypothetical protein